MWIRKICWIGMTAFSVMLGLAASSGFAQEIKGIVKKYDTTHRLLTLEQPGLHKDIVVHLTESVSVKGLENEPLALSKLQKGDRVKLSNAVMISSISVEPKPTERTVHGRVLAQLHAQPVQAAACCSSTWASSSHPGVQFEFPYVIYQGLTIYLLIAIGWHGGEELSSLDPGQLSGVVGFMGVGLLTNFAIGVLAYMLLRLMTKDAPGGQGHGRRVLRLGLGRHVRDLPGRSGHGGDRLRPLHAGDAGRDGDSRAASWRCTWCRGCGAREWTPPAACPTSRVTDPKAKPPSPTADAARPRPDDRRGRRRPSGKSRWRRWCIPRTVTDGIKPKVFLNAKLLHEVFLNPGLFLLFGGILIGYISGTAGQGGHPGRRRLLRHPVPGHALPVPPGNGHDGVAQAPGSGHGRRRIHRLRPDRAEPFRDHRDCCRAPYSHLTRAHRWSSVPMCFSRYSVARRRTSRCRRCSGWRYRKRARLFRSRPRSG